MKKENKEWTLPSRGTWREIGRDGEWMMVKEKRVEGIYVVEGNVITGLCNESYISSLLSVKTALSALLSISVVLT